MSNFLQSVINRLKGQAVSSNAILMLYVEYKKGWVFSDENRGVVDEPFVAGIDDIITKHLKKLGILSDAKKRGFILTFSGRSFPSHNVKLTRGKSEDGGVWYTDASDGEEGWLCPCLFRYFKSAPKELYASFRRCAS